MLHVLDTSLAPLNLGDLGLRHTGSDVELLPGAKADMMLSMAKLHAESFRQRGWLLRVADHGTDFLTSDRPVCSYRVNGNTFATGLGGAGMPDVWASYPLTSRLVLLGAPRHQTSRTRVKVMTRRQVAISNAVTMFNSVRHVWSRTQTFAYAPGKDIYTNPAAIVCGARRLHVGLCRRTCESRVPGPAQQCPRHDERVEHRELVRSLWPHEFEHE